MECTCGGTIEPWEMLDSDIIGNEEWIEVQGECERCGKRYKWDEVYVFDRFENLEEIADE